ncbi:MAG: zinc metalloprotease [Thermoanaerobaculia bacterium]
MAHDVKGLTMHTRTHNTRGAALAIALTVLVADPGWVSAQTNEIADFLQSFPRSFDRTDLPLDIRFMAEDGRTERHGAKCGTRPVGFLERALVEAAVEDFLAGHGRWHRYGEVDIPVVFHLVRTADRVGHVKKKHAKKQIRILNRAYKAQGFRFELQEIRRHTNDEFTRGCLDVEVEREFKRHNAVDPAHTLNIYTCIPEDGVLGYSYQPWDFNETSFMHGVVLLYSTLPKGSARPYNLGDTLTHEVGHYLGLLHTFEGGCADGDKVADTPAEQTPAYGCPHERDTCSAPGMDPVRNFMNYSDDSCMNKFTAGQGSRMQDMAAVFRRSL